VFVQQRLAGDQLTDVHAQLVAVADGLLVAEGGADPDVQPELLGELARGRGLIGLAGFHLAARELPPAVDARSERGQDATVADHRHPDHDLPRLSRHESPLCQKTVGEQVKNAVMPLQNRVLPTGEIVSDPGRGLLMGNRGSLHGPDQQLRTARWRSKAWICCVLDWKGVQRDPMPLGRWTALFFLDEATALAAGHRPCAHCRRRDFLQYAGYWARGHGLAERPRAAAMDAQLHLERVEPRTRRQRTTVAELAELPDGAMIWYGDRPALVLGGRVLGWSWQGYSPPVEQPAHQRVVVLTPPANLVVLTAGFAPLLHPTADTK
jgi:hypothetical protein